MNIMLIPEDEMTQNRRTIKKIEKDKMLQNRYNVKESIEKARKRRKYYTKYNSEIQKKKAACRNNNLDPNGSVGKGYITEVIVAKFLGIDTCFDITGNFNYPGYDVLEHKDFGKINVKGSLLLYSGNGAYHCFHTNKNIKPDFFFCIGYDREMKRVVSVYIILNDDYVNTLRCIHIPYNGNSKWNGFKESEEEICKWDDLFHTLKLKNCPILRTV